MLRAALTLVLVVAALSLALTDRGSALLGFARPLLVAALILMGVLQIHRLATMRNARQRTSRLDKIPKRPLGI